MPQAEAEDLEEAGNEVMLLDDEAVPYVVGECLVHLPREEVEERLQTGGWRGAADPWIPGWQGWVRHRAVARQVQTGRRLLQQVHRRAFGWCSAGKDSGCLSAALSGSAAVVWPGRPA